MRKQSIAMQVWFVALSAALAGCNGLGGLLVSNEDEVTLGEGVDEQIEGEYRIVQEDDPVAQWARELVAPLVTASAQFRNPAEISGYDVEVLYEDELINAFAAPGGFTYISSGLILQASSCAEIAGVMGHELAHVTERHSVKQIEAQFAATTIIGFFLDEGLAASAAATVWAFLQNTSFSRQDESESDDIGAEIMFDAGYNPFGLVDFFTRLQELSGGSSPPTFLSSHPDSGDRAETITAKIESKWGSEVVRGQTQSYDCIGTSLTLAQVQERIREGNVSIRPGTGQGVPEEAQQ